LLIDASSGLDGREELVQMYNDAFIPLLAERHPVGLGRQASVCWSDAWQIVDPNLERVMNGRETVYHKNAIVPIIRDGRLQNIRWTYSYSPIFGKGGKVLGVLVICQDIAIQVNASRDLRESEARASRVLQSIGDAVIDTDAEARILRMNPVAEQLTGWAIAESQGELLANVFHIVNETTHLPVESPAEKVKQTGAVVGLANHTVLIGKDGSRRAIDDSGAPILDDDGQLSGIVLIFRDIEEKRAAERERDQVTERMSQFLRATTDAIVGVDRNWVINYLNPKAEEVYEAIGRFSGEICGRHFPVRCTRIPPTHNTTTGRWTRASPVGRCLLPGTPQTCGCILMCTPRPKGL
jgi:PAS domain S-box-containing protein